MVIIGDVGPHRPIRGSRIEAYTSIYGNNRGRGPSPSHQRDEKVHREDPVLHREEGSYPTPPNRGPGPSPLAREEGCKGGPGYQMEEYIGRSESPAREEYEDEAPP